MKVNAQWRALGWKHHLWELIRYFRSLRRGGHEWLEKLERGQFKDFPVAIDDTGLLRTYIEETEESKRKALEAFREEHEAQAFCEQLGAKVGATRTKNTDHHQSSNALVAAVRHISTRASLKHSTTCDMNPQRRAVWYLNNQLHVTARNLDGAVPALGNPLIIWEIKEYWGKTGGGSKMSDAVYECHLTGLELRNFEERSKHRIVHAVLLDGKAQWSVRQSDVTRFLDLFNQGLIDNLFIGRDVETEWEQFLNSELGSRANGK